MADNPSKMKNLNIILLCGLYGSGKMQYAAEFFKGTGRCRISRSEIRELIFQMVNFGEPWSPEKFTDEDDFLIKHIERRIAEQFFHNKKNLLIINTFMSKDSRLRYVKLAREQKKTIGAVFLDSPFDICREKNTKSRMKVPDMAMNTLNMKKQLPSRDEGFEEVAIITDYRPL